jgi:hypothetical protein
MAQPNGDVAEAAAMKAILMAMIGTQAASLGSRGAQHFLEATRAAALEGIRTGSFTSAEGPVDFEAVRAVREKTLQSINEIFDRIHIEFWREMLSTRKPYASDVSDDEWALVAPYLTLLSEEAGQRAHLLRKGFNGLRSHCENGRTVALDA